MTYSIAFSQAISLMLYIGIGSKRMNCNYLSIKDISNKLSIPIPSIKKIVSMLKRNDLIESKTGVNGGLSLTRNMDEISLFSIFDSLEGNTPLFKIYDDFNVNDLKLNKSQIKLLLTNEKKIFNKTRGEMVSKLKEFSLADILKGCN